MLEKCIIQKLSPTKIKEFIKKYDFKWEEVKEIFYIELNNFQSYLVNGEYLITIKEDKIETIDYHKQQP